MITTYELMEALEQLMHDAERSVRLEGQVVEQRGRVLELEQLVRELGTGISIEKQTERNMLRLEVLVDAATAYQMRDTQAFAVWIGAEVARKLGVLLEKGQG